MSIPKVIPTPSDIGREVLIVVGGALIAAFIMSNWPWARTYIRNAWNSPPPA